MQSASAAGRQGWEPRSWWRASPLRCGILAGSGRGCLLPRRACSPCARSAPASELRAVSAACLCPCTSIKPGERAASAMVLLGGPTFALWHFGRFWPGVPPASEDLFTLRQVWPQPAHEHAVMGVKIPCAVKVMTGRAAPVCSPGCKAYDILRWPTMTGACRRSAGWLCWAPP